MNRTEMRTILTAQNHQNKQSNLKPMLEEEDLDKLHTASEGERLLMMSENATEKEISIPSLSLSLAFDIVISKHEHW